MEQIKVKVNGGYLVATATPDNMYPGIDIEYIADDDGGEHVSAPRVLFEFPKDGELRALVWTDKDNEDYTHKLGFTIDEVVINKNAFAMIKKIVQDEYNVFMNEMLRKDSKAIFDYAKKIDVYSELHGYILDCLEEEFSANQVSPLLGRDNILDALYHTYLDNDCMHCNTYGDTKRIVDELLDQLMTEDKG